MTNRKKIIAIVGPTASGKTALAVKIAREFNGEIVSADSRQVYRGLDLGTGKEGKKISNLKSQISKINTRNETIKGLAKNIRYIGNVPQWIIDVAEPGKRFTLFDWLGLARSVIEDIFERGKVPIVTGGTGLYVQALVEGFTIKMQNANLKSQNDSVKCKIFKREKLEQLPREKLVSILRKLDLGRLKTVDKNNPRRLIRAIELAQEESQPGKTKPDFETLQIGIDLPRHRLYQKIDQRVEKRFKQGMLEEVEELLRKGVDPEWLIGLGLEYKVITEYLMNNPNLKIQISKLQFKIQNLGKGVGGEETFRQMEQELKYKSHGYARRQLTWFRRFPEIKWVKNFQEAEKLVRTFLE